MRVTDAMLYNNADLSIGAARSKVADATEQVSSGIRFQHPGDDPAAAAGVVLHSTAGSYATAVVGSASAAAGELSTADGTLNGVSNALARARELAVQLSNDSYNATDRANGAVEVGQIFQQVVAALNAKSGDRYLFGGSQDQSPPFDAAGNYNGDAQVRTIEVAPGVQQAASVRADVAIKGVGGGVDVLTALTTLQTALASNDQPTIQAAISQLATGTAQVAQVRAQAGADVDALDAATSVATTAKTAETKAVSNLQDADVVDAATQLQLAQTALQSAVTASTQSFKFSLLNPSG